jgi:HSP20 family protein
MADIGNKALQAKEKREAKSAAEHTRPGPIFTPAVDIFETDEQITVLADMPGVKAKDLTIDLRDNILTLAGEAARPEGEKEIYMVREYQTGTYLRQFSISEVIDQAKIDAEMKDGVLRLVLPKAEPAKPRKIMVKTG